VPQKPAEQSMVVVKASPKQGRATMDSDFSYPQSSYLLKYMMVTNRTLFRRTGSSNSTLMLTISSRWSLNTWSLCLNTGSCCQACTFSHTMCSTSCWAWL